MVGEELVHDHPDRDPEIGEGEVDLDPDPIPDPGHVHDTEGLTFITFFNR